MQTLRSGIMSLVDKESVLTLHFFCNKRHIPPVLATSFFNVVNERLLMTATQNATTQAGTPSENHDFGLVRLPDVLKLIPVSRSHWLNGVASGIYPKPVKLSTRCVAWRLSSLRSLIDSF